ncbi:MAG: phosphoadenylyl-sulfate reductase [Rhodobacteraceae bacterium]|nr:phosphoadenylyl-sulfate reductase [Paracoccaceae bacterium]
MPRPLDPLPTARLNTRFGDASAETILAVALDRFDGEIAMVSSFGADSAVLLHMLAALDPSVPVLMLDTLMLFPETIAYQRDLSAHLGLTDVRRISPDTGAIEQADPNGDLNSRDSIACCDLRKVVPLRNALAPFTASISGRKRFQTGQRAAMRAFEVDTDGLIKVNPLAAWTPADIAAYLDRHALPRHPLVAKGYPSIGCAPCTTPVAEGEDSRSGRWRAETREECGIHITPDGRIERKAG